MPDGPDLHDFKDQIVTLRDVMIECRRDPFEIVEMFRSVYRDPEVPASVRLMAGKMVLDRGYGETVKQFNINMDERTAGVKRSVIVLPDNGRRDAIEGPVIDAES